MVDKRWRLVPGKVSFPSSFILNTEPIEQKLNSILVNKYTKIQCGKLLISCCPSLSCSFSLECKSREALLKRKAQYSWPPRSSYFITAHFYTKNIIYRFLQNKQAELGGQLYWALPFCKAFLSNHTHAWLTVEDSVQTTSLQLDIELPSLCFQVHFPTLEKLAEKFGLILVGKRRFENYFNQFKEQVKVNSSSCQTGLNIVKSRLIDAKSLLFWLKLSADTRINWIKYVIYNLPRIYIKVL